MSIDAVHSTVVIDSGKPRINSNRFLIAETANAEKVADHFLVNSMYTRFSIPKNQHIIAESVASFLSGKGVGSEKSHVLFDELMTNLTISEFELFTKRIKRDDW